MASKFKFDVVIGNPPYQEEDGGGTQALPIYHIFMDEAYKVADRVSFITPARFLFNAGNTPQTWNEKMLNDKHLKVEYYEQDSSKVFSNTDIKGGVVITYRDANIEFGAIEAFTKFTELNSILSKVRNKNFQSFSLLIYAKDSYRFTQKLHDENPSLINLMSQSHEFDVGSNMFDVISDVFFDRKPDDKHEYVKILGRENGQVRKSKWIRREYIRQHPNLDKFKLLLPGATGIGTFGETITEPVVQQPGEGHTATFISIGAFDTQVEAENVLKFVRSKFARAMLGILKVTARNGRAAWKWVPLQDFTPQSDIDWTKSIGEIDRQLYRKYGLDDGEITFIESHVQEMK